MSGWPGHSRASARERDHQLWGSDVTCHFPDDIEAALAEFEEKLPGLAEHLEPAEPGMHTTATVDFGVVLSGQATLELDDGATVVLTPVTRASRTASAALVEPG
jgi:hypothetical protein